jgi:uncharacterized protein (TIGR03067 family)
MNSIAIAALALVLAAPAPKDPTPKAGSELVGEWACSSYTFAGFMAESDGVVFEFTSDGKLRSRITGKTGAESSVTSDSSKEPAAIEWSFPGRAGKVVGIYKLEKGTLTLCFRDSQDGERPGKFESAAGTRLSLMVFQRVEKKKE